MAVSISAACALACALALIAVALVGSVAGPVLYLAVSGGIVLLQSTPAGRAVALSGAGDPPYELHPWGLALVAVAGVAALLAWSRTCAGAAPLGTRLRRPSWLAPGVPSSS